jgi:hypothetical protein
MVSHYVDRGAYLYTLDTVSVRLSSLYGFFHVAVPNVHPFILIYAEYSDSRDVKKRQDPDRSRLDDKASETKKVLCSRASGVDHSRNAAAGTNLIQIDPQRGTIEKPMRV